MKEKSRRRFCQQCELNMLEVHNKPRRDLGLTETMYIDINSKVTIITLLYYT